MAVFRRSSALLTKLTEVVLPRSFFKISMFLFNADNGLVRLIRKDTDASFHDTVNGVASQNRTSLECVSNGVYS